MLEFIVGERSPYALVSAGRGASGQTFRVPFVFNHATGAGRRSFLVQGVDGDIVIAFESDHNSGELQVRVKPSPSAFHGLGNVTIGPCGDGKIIVTVGGASLGCVYWDGKTVDATKNWLRRATEILGEPPPTSAPDDDVASECGAAGFGIASPTARPWDATSAKRREIVGAKLIEDVKRMDQAAARWFADGLPAAAKSALKTSDAYLAALDALGFNTERIKANRVESFEASGQWGVAG